MTSHEWGEGSEVDGVRRITANGLACVQLRTALAEALIYVQGAHVAHFQPAGAEAVLWMSENAVYAAGKALRGGVPICFPWFGNHPERKDAPAHGFARTRPWVYRGSVARSDGSVRLVFELVDDAETRALWPHAFRAQMSVTVAKQLELKLEVTAADAGFTYEAALHSYFAVSDVRKCQVEGLSGVAYFDKLASETRHESSSALKIDAETDRVYESTGTCRIHDPNGRTLRIDKSGSGTTVVWNPWLEKAKKMSDFGDDEWPRMLCIESASVGASRVALGPGETHRLVQWLSVDG